MQELPFAVEAGKLSGRGAALRCAVGQRDPQSELELRLPSPCFKETQIRAAFLTLHVLLMRCVLK